MLDVSVLECGNLERGFARIRCDHCEHEYLLAFSCKSRCFCPSCHQKNVQTTARFILDQVVAPVPHRHYVLAHLAFRWLEGGLGVAWGSQPPPKHMA